MCDFSPRVQAALPLLSLKSGLILFFPQVFLSCVVVVHKLANVPKIQRLLVDSLKAIQCFFVLALQKEITSFSGKFLNRKEIQFPGLFLAFLGFGPKPLCRGCSFQQNLTRLLQLNRMGMTT